MCSRVLGLVREVLFNSLFGTAWMGVFVTAFRIPNLLRDLFAEGALSTAFVTVFSKKIERDGDKSAWELASKVMTLVTIFMSVVTLLGIFFASPLIGVLAGKFAPEYKTMTILLTQIMFPFILMVSLAALVMGMLNSKGAFGVPAMASSFFNIGSIAGGVAIGWLLDPAFGEKALIGLAIGTLVGGFLQLAVQLPTLWKVGFRFRPDFRWLDPGVSQILILMVPSVIAASAVQVNVLINTRFVAEFGSAPVSWLNNAFRLMQLPLGMFGVAVATITLPVVSRIAANVDQSLFGPTLGRAMRLAIFLTLPSAVGLWFLARPIISLIYEHHKVLPEDSIQTGLALQFYALGLVAYSCIKVLSPAFYAIDRKWSPMMVSFGSIALNIVLSYYFLFKLNLGPKGLAFSTSISATMNFLVLYFLMHRHGANLETGKLFSAVLRCALAAAVLGVICFFAMHFWGDILVAEVFWKKGLVLFGVILVAAAGYIGACFLLRVDEVTEAFNLASRKILRRVKKNS